MSVLARESTILLDVLPDKELFSELSTEVGSVVLQHFELPQPGSDTALGEPIPSDNAPVPVIVEGWNDRFVHTRHRETGDSVIYSRHATHATRQIFDEKGRKTGVAHFLKLAKVTLGAGDSAIEI